MDGHQLSNVIITAIVMSGVLVVMVTQAIIRLRATRTVGSGESITPAIEQRLERMEQAIESVAVEVERISEAQRFTAKLLSDRVDQASRPPERVITPR